MKVQKRLTLLSALGVGIMSVVIIVQSPELMNSTTVQDTEISVQEQKVKIKSEQLPNPVKKTLRNEAYQGWKVVNVFLITADEDEKSYEVELRKNQEAQLIRFDRDGKLK